MQEIKTEARQYRQADGGPGVEDSVMQDFRFDRTEFAHKEIIQALKLDAQHEAHSESS